MKQCEFSRIHFLFFFFFFLTSYLVVIKWDMRQPCVNVDCTYIMLYEVTLLQKKGGKCLMRNYGDKEANSGKISYPQNLVFESL